MFDKLWKVSLSVGILAAVAGAIAYWATREPVREMTPLMEDLARDATRDFAARLPRVRTVDTVLFVVAGRGGRDEELQFREMLTEAVRGSSKYRIKTWEDVERFVDESTYMKFYTQFKGWEMGTPPVSMEQAVKVGQIVFEKAKFADGVLFIDVQQFTEGPNRDGLGARIAIEGRLFSLRSDKVEAEIPEEGQVVHEITSAWDSRYISYQISETSWLLRLLAWFISATALPWVLIGLVRTVVKRKQNELNLALLLSLTVFDVALAWLLLTALGTGAGAIVSLLLVAGLMGYYNYDACDYIERRLL